jgi:hypothetical protein
MLTNSKNEYGNFTISELEVWEIVNVENLVLQKPDKLVLQEPVKHVLQEPVKVKIE